MGILSKTKTFFEKVGSEIEKLFGGTASVEQKIQAVITYIAPIVSSIIGLADPKVAPEVSGAIAMVQTDLATVSAVVQAGTAAPGSTGAQTATTALNSVKTNLGALLTDAGVKNSTKFSEISAAANLIIGEVEAAIASLTAKV